MTNPSASIQKLALLMICVLMAGCVHLPAAQAAIPYVACKDDKVRLESRANELQTIVKADQDDREDWQSKTADEMTAVLPRDEERRKRVGEIYGEGCFVRAEDYSAAALVYQHGAVPDHFFQTFLWAKRAVELGDDKQKRLMALGIDRYLVNSGMRQLFGSQANRPGADPNGCWCIQKIERSFPEKRRQQYMGQALSAAFQWLKELNAGKSCPVKECDEALKPTPRGSVPGFW
jgi:hypothetical protein